MAVHWAGVAGGCGAGNGTVENVTGTQHTISDSLSPYMADVLLTTVLHVANPISTNHATLGQLARML